MAVPSPAPSVAPTPPNKVSFRLGIAESLQYSDMAQVPYPLPAISEADDLTSTTRSTAENIRQAASLQDFIASKQLKTLGALPEAVSHPASTLFQSYVEEGIPVSTGPPWPRAALDEAIRNGPHASACALDMVCLIWG